MSEDLMLELPGPVVCPDCGDEIDIEHPDCRFIVIVICPRCSGSFQYEEEPRYH